MGRRRRRRVPRVAQALGRALLSRPALIGYAAVAAPICAINLAVAFFGATVVFPLSPFHLGGKLRALGAYAAHRPRCLFFGHPPLGPMIARAESAHRLPPGLLAALVTVESDGRVHRISPAGAMGPAQLVPSTARLLGVRDPFDPEANIDGSARYLAAQLARFHNARLAVAAYNAGPGAVVGGAVPRNGETEHYVARVMAAWRRHKNVVAMAGPHAP